MVRIIGTLSISIVVVLTIVSIVLAALLLTLLFLCRKRSKPVKCDEEKSTPVPIPSPVRQCAPPIPFSHVDALTNGFNPRYVLGKGRIGTIYTVITSAGDAIAIKRVHHHLVLLNPGGSRFAAKIKSLSLIHHPNIVPIIGYSEAPGERIILTNLFGAKTLDYYLHQNPNLLSWAHRTRIAAGAALGLEHLHEGNVPYVVHGSMQASNIVIDGDFNARVRDYGLSFLKGEGCGKEDDVYGFGVVLLELLSGRRFEEEGLGFVEWGLELIRGCRVVELLDPRVGRPNDLKGLVRLAKVASACVGNGSKSRPSIVHVAAILNNIVDMHDQRFASVE